MIQYFLDDMDKSFESVKQNWSVLQSQDVDTVDVFNLIRIITNGIKEMRNLLPSDHSYERQHYNIIVANLIFKDFCDLYENFIKKDARLNSEENVSERHLKHLVDLSDVLLQMIKTLSLN